MDLAATRRVRLRGLRTWLLLLVATAAAPGLYLVLTEHSEERERFEKEVRATAASLARAAAAAERAKLEDARGLVSGLAELPSVRSHDGPTCSALFEALRGRHPTFANAGAATPEGDVFCSGLRGAPKVNIADREYFRRALVTRAPTVGERAIGKHSGAPSVHVAAPSLDAAGNVAAVVFVGLDLRAMSSRLEQFPLPPGATLTVVDRNGVVLASSQGAAESAGRKAKLEGSPGALRRPSGVIEGAGLDGVVRVNGHATVSLEGTPDDLVVIAGLSRDPLRAAADARAWKTTVGYALALLAGLVAAWLIGDLLLVHRLGRLAGAARRLSGGDLDARTELRSSDEIGELGRAFDEMAVAVDRLTRQNRLILESVGVGIYGVGVDGKITMMNPAAARMLRCTPADALGRDSHDFLHHHDAQGRPNGRERCPLVAALADGQVRRGESDVFWRADGTSFPVEFVTTPMREDGGIVGATVTFHDVTARRQLESQLRQAQKIEAVGRLAGGIAHDFNNLLTAVLSIGHSLAEDLAPEHPLQPEVAELLSAGRRAAELTRQLLAFSRKQVLAPKALDPNAVICGLEGMLGRLVPENVRVTAELRATGMVLADRSQLEQVIMNLVVNARDAMPRGGEIRIATTDIDLVAGASEPFDAPPGPYVMLCVADEGTGMDADTLSRVFEPFFTTKGPAAGTGLGLSTVYGIVKQSGGDVRVESALGIGTLFEIVLPRCGAASSQVSDVAPATPPTATRRRELVLVVEDNPLVRAVTCRTLANAGYRVVEAPSAEEALSGPARNGRFDLLVTDVGLPGLNGRELAAQMRSVHPGLKTLLVSGHTGDTRVDPAEPHGAFLQKPYTPATLLGSVRELLERA